MNILIIPAFFRTTQRPTLGSFFWEQAEALKNAGHDVTVIYCDTYSVKCIKEYINYSEKEIEDLQGINIYRKRVLCPLKHGIEGHREAFAKAVLELYDKYLSDKKNIEIIHAHCCIWAGYSAMQLSRKTKIPYVITEHATIFQLHRDKISKKNDAYIADAFRNASKVICVSGAFRKLLGSYTANIEVIGNVTDCDRFCLPRKGSKTDKDNKCSFLTICYMEEEAQLYKKGIDILLEVWAGIVSENKNVRLTIGGGGKASKKVVEWIDKYGISDSVELIGPLERDRVAEQMQRCDCFVLPSRYETFGVVYIEAMACGKPVIAAANGGPDDFVKDFNGILIEPDNKWELAAAIRRIADIYENGENVYQAEKIAEYAKENFSGEAIALKLDRLYKSIIDRQSGADYV